MLENTATSAETPQPATFIKPLTKNELKAILDDCSEGYLRALMRSGALRYIRLGRKILFDPADVYAMLENFKVNR